MQHVSSLSASTSRLPKVRFDELVIDHHDEEPKTITLKFLRNGVEMHTVTARDFGGQIVIYGLTGFIDIVP